MTLARLLRRACESCPGRVAVEVEGTRTLTYESWERRSTAQARGLAAAGVRPGDRVALLFGSTRWTDYAVAYIAAQKAGAVAVPLGDELSDIELRRILHECDASAVVAAESRSQRLAERVPIILAGEVEHSDGQLPSVPPPEPAEILYASHPLRSPVGLDRSARDVVTVPQIISPAAGPTVLHSFAPGTVAAQDMLGAALSPAMVRSLVLPDFVPDRLRAVASAREVRACALHPAAAKALIDVHPSANHYLSGLSSLVLVRGRVSGALVQRLAAAFPSASLLLVDVLSSSPGARSVLAYDRGRPRSVGRPAAQTPVIVADERGRPLPTGQTGQVWTNGAPAGARGHVDEQGFLYLQDGGHALARPGADLASAVGDPSVAPVAGSQEGMLWQEYFVPGSQNLPGLARRYRGALDAEALRRALEEIIRRHGALRTTFGLRDAEPVQVVRLHRPLDLPVCDLSDRAPSDREAELQRLVRAAGERPFDLVEGPLFQPTLLRLDEEEHVLLIRTHHTVFDDWSVGVFRRELAALYPAYAAGEPSPLPEPPVQFADVSRRHRDMLAGSGGERQLSYWRRELAGAPFVTQLPVDDPNLPPGAPQQAGGPITLELSTELCDALRELARRQRATLFMTVLAAFGLLVARYSGEDDLLLATVVANRNRTELEGLIGCFTKKVPLRLRLSGDPPFSEAMARTRAALLGALAHQDLPFEGVIQEVLGPSAASHGLVPHVPIMFQGVTPQPELTLPNIETAGLETSTTATRAHFMATGRDEPAETLADVPWGGGLYLGTFVIVSLNEGGEGMSLSARGAFHGPAVDDLMKSFRTLLADAAAHPGRRASQLAVLDVTGEDEALRRGLGPVTGSSSADTVSGAFTAQVQRTPHVVALAAGAERLTFSQLDAEADRLADRLRALGVGPGSRVGVSLRASAELVLAVLGVWKAGAACVGLDPADGTRRRERIVREASLAAVLAGAAGADLAARLRVETGEVGDGPAMATEGSAGAAAPSEPAVVFYGSGASAVARGVVLDQRAVLALLAGLRDAVYGVPSVPPHPRRVCLCADPFADAFLRQLVALLDGHCLRVPDSRLEADPGEALSLLGAGEVDLLDCTVDEFGALREAGLYEVLGRRDHPLEAGVVVGTRSDVGPELWRGLRAIQGARGQLVFGLPECAFGATVATAGESAPRGVGHPMTGVRSVVLDASGRPVPTGATGELYLGGPSLASGYLGDPHATGERFVQLPLTGAPERLHRTGQLARALRDGGVELLGPSDGRERLRGFRVNHAGIRSALRRAPGVRDVRLAHRSDDRGERRLVAEVAVEAETPTPDGLRGTLWSTLPGYAWPASIRSVSEPGASGPAAAADGGRVAPGWERSMLSTLWAEVLGLEELSPEENYWQAFSFLEALVRAREAGLPVPLEHVMRNRTLGTLAASLAASRSPTAASSQAAPRRSAGDPPS